MGTKVIALRPDESTSTGIARTIVLLMREVVPILNRVTTTFDAAVGELAPLTQPAAWPDSRRRDADICADMSVAIDEHVVAALDALDVVKRVVTRALKDLDHVLERKEALHDRLGEFATTEASTR